MTNQPLIWNFNNLIHCKFDEYLWGTNIFFRLITINISPKWWWPNHLHFKCIASFDWWCHFKIDFSCITHGNIQLSSYLWYTNIDIIHVKLMFLVLQKFMFSILNWRQRRLLLLCTANILTMFRIQENPFEYRPLEDTMRSTVKPFPLWWCWW